MHPWHLLRDTHPDVLVVHTDALPDGVLGATDGHVIWLDRDQTQAERRCTLLHEITHIERGHAGCQDPRTEAAVEAETARLLIRLEALGEALAWSRWEDEVADELWVDTATLRARVASLTDAERAYLARRLEGL